MNEFSFLLDEWGTAMQNSLEIFQEHARKNLFMIQQETYYRNLHQFFDWLSNSRWGFKKTFRDYSASLESSRKKVRLTIN